jgi:GrpB-like predicted nucleotidyltransferase (UPF0157 family)
VTGEQEAIREPLTEEQIRAATVGDVQALNAPVRLADYDPEWPALFVRERVRICGALGDRVLRLEHTGSTSVPGLAAKPIIDMLLVVRDSGDEAAYAPDLEAAGYVLRIRERDWHQHRVFKGPDTNVNLHVLSVGSPEIERILAFRDRLRADEGDRRLYEDTKRRLAAQRWRYVQNYADAKTQVVEEIIVRGLHAPSGAVAPRGGGRT